MRDEALAREAVVAIQAWRQAWLLALDANELELSPALLAVLGEAFGATAPARIRSLPYRLLPFPEPLSGAPIDDLKKALLWRAGLVDFLADCWDTLGPATFDLEECLRVSERLMPSESPATSHCAYCLTPVVEGGTAQHFGQCPVQRVWRR